MSPNTEPMYGNTHKTSTWFLEEKVTVEHVDPWKVEMNPEELRWYEWQNPIDLQGVIRSTIGIGI